MIQDIILITGWALVAVQVLGIVIFALAVKSEKVDNVNLNFSLGLLGGLLLLVGYLVDFSGAC